MKKNITINLSGRLYQIDEDAYELLKQYTESLRSAFGKQEGGDEIVDDIESRIAELFDELKQNGAAAITIDNVKDIITRIGKPEELTGEDGEEKSEKKDETWEDKARNAANGLRDNIRQRTAGKKLFRNPKDKVLCGVLSGFAAYTGTESWIWRLLMIVFTMFYGIGILFYVVLAIIIPEPKTAEDFLRMEGKEITPGNIATAVVDKDKDVEKNDSGLRTFFSVIIKIIFGFIIGSILLGFGSLAIGVLAIALIIITALLVPAGVALPLGIEELGISGMFAAQPAVPIIFAIALILVIAIPIYALVHLIVSSRDNSKSMCSGQRIFLVILWIVSFITLIPTGFTMVVKGSDQAVKEYNLRHNENGDKDIRNIEDVFDDIEDRMEAKYGDDRMDQIEDSLENEVKKSILKSVETTLATVPAVIDAAAKTEGNNIDKASADKAKKKVEEAQTKIKKSIDELDNKTAKDSIR